MSESTTPPSAMHCALCDHNGIAAELVEVRCNVRRFRDRRFKVWRCGQCRSLHCEPVADLGTYYDGYPIRNQTLDFFSRAWYRVVLKRLIDAGLHREHSILDYGCNQGLFLQFLRENGHLNCRGYDPYVDKFSDASVLGSRYDHVVCLDVIEHDLSPSAFLAKLAGLLKPGGKLCIETPNAEGIDLHDAEEYLHALHVPYHVHVLSKQVLETAGRRRGLRPVKTFNRWYMDAWWPGTSRLLIESLLKYGDNDIDSGYEPPRLGLFIRHPQLLVFLLFGYFLPSRKSDHMMMIFTTDT